MSRRNLLAAAVLMASGLAAGAARGEGYYLVDNFSAALPGNATMSVTPDTSEPKVGLASGRVAYKMAGGSAGVNLPDGLRSVAAAGALKVWVKGDGSGNELQIVLRHANVKTTPEGWRVVEQQQDLRLAGVKLDFATWKEVTLDASAIPAGRTAWVDSIRISPVGNEPKTEGTIWLDDMRVVPKGEGPSGTFQADLIGPTVRTLSPDIAMSLDIRSFAKSAGKVRARMVVTDRNENVVADRDLPLELEANGSKEVRLEAKPEAVESFLPPFKVVCEVISSDLPEIGARVEKTLVLGNSFALYDDMSNVTGRWFTAGLPPTFPMHTHSWHEWAHAEGQRFTAEAQTSARIERVEVTDAPAAGEARDAAASPTEEVAVEAPSPRRGGRGAGGARTAAGGVLVSQTPPLGKWAMKLAFNGHAIAWTGVDRYLPGNAYRMGVWVKGDGSGATLSALVLDYTDGAEYWPGGWKRTTADLPVCALNFTGWKYFEVGLPGNGVGKNTPRGSTFEIDYPLELTAFHVTGARGEDSAKGEVQIGSVYVHTQQPSAGALTVQVGYDNANLEYDPKASATVTVQNSWRMGGRKVKVSWSVLDRNDTPVGSGNADLELTAMEAKSFVVPAEKINMAIGDGHGALREGPYKLVVMASDVKDVAAAATRELVISRPDSVVSLADFESARSYVGLRAAQMPPAVLGVGASTSSTQAHGGKQSLAIEWDKARKVERFVSIDPPLPGVPTEVSMWVYGDNSGALVYPLFGDRGGVIKGAPQGQWNLLLGRAVDGPLANAVKLDFTGWKQVTFKLPVPQAGWKLDTPTPAFVPNYPLGLHVCVMAEGATTEAGTVYVDDITVRTQLPAERRMNFEVVRGGESNVIKAGEPLKVRVANYDASGVRKAALTGGLYDWRDVCVAKLDQPVELRAGEQREFVLSEHVPAGAYRLKVSLEEPRAAKRETPSTVEPFVEDVIVGDLAAYMGSDAAGALKDPWKLRAALRDKFTFVDEDWDWVEAYPGNVQLESIRTRIKPVTANGAEPYVLLGYSAYWAAGGAAEQLKAGQYARPQRDIGHAVDIFMPPSDLGAWDSYVREVMRGVGKEVGGFVVWNNPDTDGPMGVKPAKFATMLTSVGKYRKMYCPSTPVLIGGLNRATAVAYLTELAKEGALEHVTGVNVRMDVGRVSPEDAEISGYVEELRAVLDGKGKDDGRTPKRELRTILLTDLDWGVERAGSGGLTSFDQAAYLVRSELLTALHGIEPAVSVKNEDDTRLGLGLTWRNSLSVPPMKEKLGTYQLRPGYWGLVRVRKLLADLESPVEVGVVDEIPGLTRCLVFARKADQKQMAMVWRNDVNGRLSFSMTGLKVEGAEDVLGAGVSAGKDGSYGVGKMPIVLTLGGTRAEVSAGLARLRVADESGMKWSQRIWAALPAEGGTVATFSGRTVAGELKTEQGRKFATGDSERIAVEVPKEADLVLRKRWFLDETGQSAEVKVNGVAVGVWDLTRSDASLSGGFRESVFVLPRAALKGGGSVELKYLTAGNSLGWQVMEMKAGETAMAISAVGVVHADQNVSHVRWGRNTIGSPMKVGSSDFGNGIGVFARSLVEVPLNGQYSRFKAKVGVDAATEGRGSVVFEVYADGKKLWGSPVMSGLDTVKEVDVDVKGAKRLRLVVGDGGDGNKSDAADWGEAELVR